MSRYLCKREHAFNHLICSAYNFFSLHQFCTKIQYLFIYIYLKKVKRLHFKLKEKLGKRES